MPRRTDELQPEESLRRIRSARLRIGLEIHVELATATKVFCRAPNGLTSANLDAPPNSLVDPLVAGMPGVLPVLNRDAVRRAVLVGLALNCRIARHSKWDRKSYFYPDLPKGYQISQYDEPLCCEGWVDLPTTDDPAGPTKRIRVTRAHLEEDAGKLGHELPGGGSFEGTLLDLNRAGTPLLEIVTEPDFNSADEVVRFGRLLRETCRFLDVSPCIMQRGHMRFEPNINLVIEDANGSSLETPIVEIKNLNSFRSVQAAIEHEFERQQQEWTQGGRVHGPGEKTTRGWDDGRQTTFLQRGKEDAEDYRYFPDPDLVPVEFGEPWIESMRTAMPELPLERRRRYVQDLALGVDLVQQLMDEPSTAEFFDACVTAVCDAARSESSIRKVEAARLAANFVLQYGGKYANERACLPSQLGITPQQVAEIILLRHTNRINSNAAETLFELLFHSDAKAEALAEKSGLLQITDDSAMAQWVMDAIREHPKVVESILAGRINAIGVLVGAVMKASRGQADARAVDRMIRQELGV